MADLVADTSGLVSLGSAAGSQPDPLAITTETYNVLVPEHVVGELRDIAAYEDDHGDAAQAALDELGEMTTRSVSLDPGFPLDDGENAAVTLANETGAALLLCDEFNRLGLVHASLADTRLVTTPTLLSVLVRTDLLSTDEGRSLLDTISAARSWDRNSYVERARDLF